MDVNFADKLNDMKLPFDSETFFNVFMAYNSAIWPLQIVLYLLSLLVLALLLKLLLSWGCGKISVWRLPR